MEQVRSNPLVCIIKQFLQKYTNNDNKDDRERWLIHLNNQGGSSECCKQPSDSSTEDTRYGSSWHTTQHIKTIKVKAESMNYGSDSVFTSPVKRIMGVNFESSSGYLSTTPLVRSAKKRKSQVPSPNSEESHLIIF